MACLSPDPQEMVRYFSDFLTEINLIIHHIKLHAYQMIEVSVPSPTLLTVYQSMASIVSSTHKTYDNLKRIQSVMSGVIKSKRMERDSAPATPIHKFISKSMENDIFFYPPKSFQNPLSPKISPQQLDCQSRTVKKQKMADKSPEREVPIGRHRNEIEELEREEDEKTIKILNQKHKQQREELRQQREESRQQREECRQQREECRQQREEFRPMKEWKKIIVDRINSLIDSNRSNLTKIMNKNEECLRLVRSVKKQIKAPR